MPPNKVVIDTDPGCDDVLALLYLLASSPDDFEIALISVTYGNITVKGCLQNVISTFHVIEKEMQWRNDHGRPEGFRMLKKHKPTIAVGAEGPMNGETLVADYYHGRDGLGGVHTSHPHHTSPAETWLHLFDPPLPNPPTDDLITVTATTTTHESPATSKHLFKPSSKHAVEEILTLLSSSPPGTVTLIAIGPLTNFALAAAQSPQTFLRAKAVLVMGGAIDKPGNITPVAEFNCIADPIAAASIYALTSPDPRTTTMPSPSGEGPKALGVPYPRKEDLGHKRLNVVLFPLDVTTPHILRQAEVDTVTEPLIALGSPLAEWLSAFTSSTFRNHASLQEDEGAHMSLHDPVVVWYALTSGDAGWVVQQDEDIRVETMGQWTRGMCVVDRRGRKRLVESLDIKGDESEMSGDRGGWLSRWRGNRVGRCVTSPNGDMFGKVLLDTIFGE